ncbi:protease modulator HflC [Xenorhabdus sp. ZM]|uniref:protease modulator HflC n=1 Tax=Xenorhabdus szentirmaii TaxID=290112 RepID=UPI00199444A7|nr:protease modulator HflC [Xenorhabdus sp. ZM]MBD2803738.1 protease modulator HflC [Xenorhabdus sp. ZM]
MRNSFIVGIIAVLVALYSSVFTVKEGERGIVLRFSKVVRDANDNPVVYEPGLHFKIPFVETVKTLNARIQTLDITADRFLTNEKKDLMVDSYLKWRVKDFSRYYRVTGGDTSRAENLLKRKFTDRLRAEIGRLDVKGIVTDSRGRLTTDVRDALNEGTHEEKAEKKGVNNDVAPIAPVTEEINSTQSAINVNSMAELGIEVVDVRIKQINLPPEISDAIYQRMRADREAEARLLRSEGLEEAEEVRAKADKKATETKAEANSKALSIRGDGDAEATRLFADAFSKDPEFYAFVRSLRAYENSFKNEGNIMVLSPDNDFFRYMKEPSKQRYNKND